MSENILWLYFWGIGNWEIQLNVWEFYCVEIVFQISSKNSKRKTHLKSKTKLNIYEHFPNHIFIQTNTLN